MNGYNGCYGMARCNRGGVLLEVVGIVLEQSGFSEYCMIL